MIQPKISNATKAKGVPVSLEKTRCRFYQGLSTFRKRLINPRTNGQGKCCGCKASGVSTTFYNLKKEFESLKIATNCMPDWIYVCLWCAPSYMNSFNRALAKIQGREYEGDVWHECDGDNDSEVTCD